ncbi:hypothetical protein BGW41_000445 [Actinomortierella wolfii]|nr:hypothetical protein BGW41_000445 [Actinomortierella wolfii]
MAQLVAALKRKLLTASPAATSNLAKSAFCPTRAYSRKTKTKYETAAAELKLDIERLQKAIAEEERRLAAKKAYEESIMRQNERIEAASTVYRELMKPQAPPSNMASTSSTGSAAAARLTGNPNAKSFLPGTFLEDLKLTFLDTRSAKEEKLRQLQSGLLSMEDLKAITPDAVRRPPSSSASDTNLPSSSSSSATAATTITNEDSINAESTSTNMVVSAEVEAKVEDAVIFERVRALDVTQWNQLIYVNALEGRPDKAEQVLKLMEEVGVSPNLETFDYLLEAYANHGDLTKARATVDLIIKNGLTPSLSAYNSLISTHVAKRDLKGAFGVLDAMKQYHNPDTTIFTNLIKGCLVVGEYDLGWRVFDQMQHSGAPPDESTYSLMIHACAKTDQVERALDIFRQYPKRNLHPTDKTFNSLIHACAVRKEYYTTAFALLNEMQNVYGFEPDILTYNTLLFACSKRQDLMTARRIFQKVVQLDSEGTLEIDGITITNFLWCVTEWKSTDVHQKNYKYRLRTERKKLLEGKGEEAKDGDVAASAAPSAADSSSSTTATDTTTTSTTTTTTTDTLAIRPDYLMLSKIPPKDEWEALAEGEMVFSWFVARAAERHPPKAEEQQKPTQLEGETQSSDITHSTTTTTNNAIATTSKGVVQPLVRVGRDAPIRTRLLNAYLAMYVRHNEVERAKDIYTRYFPHFHQARDSWTFATMLEGCYFWKDVDFGSDVFRDWRAWRKSTGKVTERRYRTADYQVYRRTANLLARTNHLREALALIEELAQAATATPAAADGTSQVGQGIASVEEEDPDKELDDLFGSSSPSPSSQSSSSSSSTSSSSTESSSSSLSTTTESSKYSFLAHVDDETVLPIYPRLQDFPAVYTKTWELEDEPARRYLLSLCSGGVETLNSADRHRHQGASANKDTHSREAEAKRRQDKSLRKLAIKWKGEHHHPDDRRGSGLYIGERRRRELEKDASKRGWGRK